MKILVLGGTKFFGTHLVKKLISQGHHVIVATRGNYQFDFKDKIQFEIADRHKLSDLKRLATLGPFDIIYDQICWYAQNAVDAVAAFNGKCKRYVFTSTGSVYDMKFGEILTEDKFDYQTYKINLKTPSPYDYQEEKRQSEAIFAQTGDFELVMPRFTYVVGPDDYTERLKFHVDANLKQTPIFVPNKNIKTGFIQSDEAGAFLSFIGQHAFCGAVNVTSGTVALSDVFSMIEKATGKNFIFADTSGEKNHSPYGMSVDYIQSNQLARDLGFKFTAIEDFMPELISYYIKKYRQDQ